jgi:hypothetical protein
MGREVTKYLERRHVMLGFVPSSEQCLLLLLKPSRLLLVMGLARLCMLHQGRLNFALV